MMLSRVSDSSRRWVAGAFLTMIYLDTNGTSFHNYGMTFHGSFLESLMNVPWSL